VESWLSKGGGVDAPGCLRTFFECSQAKSTFFVVSGSALQWLNCSFFVGSDFFGGHPIAVRIC